MYALIWDYISFYELCSLFPCTLSCHNRAITKIPQNIVLVCKKQDNKQFDCLASSQFSPLVIHYSIIEETTTTTKIITKINIINNAK